MQADLLEVNNLSVHYLGEGEPARALEDVSFSVRASEILGVVGESGCGKTTLMLGLLRLLPAAGRIVGGDVRFQGENLLSLDERALSNLRWNELAIVFQGAMNALNPVRTVGEQIAEALLRHRQVKTKKEAVSRVAELLELVGIEGGRRTQYPHQYSGGMRQRAMIAMALACNPKLVIADEPTTALDVMVQAQILELLLDLREKLDLAIILVTHDLGVVAEICDTVLVMYGGVVAEYADVDRVFNAPKHPYTQELLKAFPDLSKSQASLSGIPGQPPRLDALPSGCRFAPRCSQAFKRCHLEVPALHRVNGTVASCHLLESR